MCSSTMILPSCVVIPAPAASADCGVTPVAASTRSQSMVTPLSRRTAFSSTASTATEPTNRTPASDNRSTMRSPASTPRRASWGSRSGATRVTATPRIASEAAASHPMKPAPMTTAESACSAVARSATASASDRRYSTDRAPGTGSGDGAAPHASTRCQYPKRWPPDVRTVRWSTSIRFTVTDVITSTLWSSNQSCGCSPTSLCLPRRNSLLNGGRAYGSAASAVKM